ncbi:DMT family transporter [bacterium]|nr:DMT family transporter [bacterium]
MSSPSTRDPWSVVVALVTVQLLFGAHYVVAKIIVSRLDPAAWACLRSASAFVVLAVLALLFRRRLPDWRGIRWLALCSVFGVILNQALFLEGLARTTASHASVINTQIPSFALLGAVALGQERLTRRKVASFVVGLAGVLVLLRAETLRFDTSTLTGDLLNLGNAASYGFFIALSRRVMTREDPLAATAVLFFFATLGLGLYGGPALRAADLGALSPGVVGGMVFAVLGATVLSYFLNIWALRRTHASNVALFIFLQPVVAALLGIAALGERPTLRLGLAMALVLTALVLRDAGPRRAAVTSAPRRRS